MAINKNETLPNGLPLSYWRIVSLTCVVNNQSIIEVAGYVNQEQREREQEYDPETATEPLDVITETRFINIDYDPNLSVNQAYEYLKTLPEFSGGTDVLEAWAVNTAYYIGDMVSYENESWKCLQSHTSQAGWEPPNVPALWKKDGGGEIPEWVQPTGAQDAYAKGDKVKHNEKVWESLVDANVWEPSESVPTLWKELA